MNENIIEIRHLKKVYKNRVVFTDLNLDIKYHQITTIYGSSGAGKSTLLNIIGALDRFQEGTVKLFDKPIPKAGSRAARKMQRLQLSYLFQNFALINDQSINQNLELVRYKHQYSKEDFTIRKLQVLEQLSIKNDLKTKVGQLSGGEQQRIAVARCLLKPGELILCDEPTGSLDPNNRDQLFQMLEYAKKNGKTIVIVSHDPEIIQKSDIAVKLTDLMPTE